MPNIKTKIYSRDNEDFPYSSLGDLLDSESIEVGDSYFESECRDITPKDAIFIPDILYQLDERLGDILGEVYNNDVIKVSVETKLELQSLLEAWITKNVPLKYYLIEGRSTEFKITQSDLD